MTGSPALVAVEQGDPAVVGDSTLVSVVIPTKNGGDQLDQVLDAVLTQDLSALPPPTRRLEVICVDSGSTPSHRARLNRPGIRVIDIDPATFDHGGTRQQGIAQTSGAFVALLTQDAVPADVRWLSALVEALEAQPDAAGAWSRQISRKGADPIERWKLACWRGSDRAPVIAKLGRGETFESLDPAERYRRSAFDDVSSCLRRSAWVRTPYRPTAFGEDLDWGVRALSAGAAILFVPGSAVIHSHPARVVGDARRVYRDHRNIIRLTGWKTVPRLVDVPRAAWAGAIAVVRHVIGQADESPLRRFAACSKAMPYAFGQAVAQYAAARAERG